MVVRGVEHQAVQLLGTKPEMTARQWWCVCSVRQSIVNIARQDVIERGRGGAKAEGAKGATEQAFLQGGDGVRLMG